VKGTGFSPYINQAESTWASEAAEKGQIRDEFEQDIPRRLKPEIDLMDFSGTDKSVPFQNLGFG
jgi:hypothetical protein